MTNYSSKAYLIHYGVSGMKWGVRRYRNDDGSLTDEGYRHYGINGKRLHDNEITRAVAHPDRRSTTQKHNYRVKKFGNETTNTLEKAPKKLTPEQEQARKNRTKKIIAVAAGVTLAAALGYAAYRGTTNLRDQMRKDMLSSASYDWRDIHTLNSKYWDTKDRHRYSELTKKHVEYAANHFTRRDAIAAKFKEKTGIDINFYKDRKQEIEDRHEANEYANAIREIESRGSLNRQISKARQRLKQAKHRAEILESSRSRIQEERYGDSLRKQSKKMIEEYQDMLNELLEKRRKAS